TFPRHNEIRFDAGNRLNQQTFGAFPGNNRRPEFAAFQSDILRIQAKLRLLFPWAVAIVAVSSENRLDVLRKINLSLSSHWQLARVSSNRGYGRAEGKQ